MSYYACLKKQCPFNWMLTTRNLPLGAGGDLIVPKSVSLCSGLYRLCAQTNRFVLYLVPPPLYRIWGPTAPQSGKGVIIYGTLNFIL